MVGETTAGADGDVNTVVLPGGFTVRWSGAIVRPRTGEHFPGVGVHPDVIVKSTIDGISRGRDEVLDAAVNELQLHQSVPSRSFDHSEYR